MKAKVVENETDGFLRLYYVGLITYQQNVVSGALCVKQRGKQHLQPAPASAGRRGGPCQPWSQERPREGRGPGRQARCSCRWLRGVRPFPREGGLPPSFLSTPRRLPSGEGPCVCPPHPLDQDCLQQRKRLVQLCFPDAWHRARRTGCRASSGNSGTQESLAPGDAEGRGEFPAGPPRAGFSASTVLPFSRQSRLGISLPFLCLRGMRS